MKILLTGGAGYIGTHTAVELINSKYDVIVADNFSNSKPESVHRVEKITGVKIPLYDINVADYKALNRLFYENEIDSVIHFAGYKAVCESISSPLLYYRNNIDSTLTLLEVMNKNKVNKLIFSSSATIYGNSKIIPLTEDMKTGFCTNPYGSTKHMNEQIIKDAAAVNPSMSAILLRYFNPVGAHISGLIGEVPVGKPNNLMPYISQVSIGKLKELYVYGNDYRTSDGTGVRDYIHVVDLAKGHVAALNYCIDNKGVDIFNLGTGVGYSVLEVIHTFEKVNNVVIPYKIVSRRSGDVAESYADQTKAEKLLKWKAKLSLEDMCRDTWNWQIKNPNGYETSLEVRVLSGSMRRTAIKNA